jgi:hypothetical protein
VHRLDVPLATSKFRKVSGAGLVLAEAGDGMHDLLADMRAAGVVAVAADPRDLPDVRELDLLGASDSDRAITSVIFRAPWRLWWIQGPGLAG